MSVLFELERACTTGHARPATAADAVDGVLASHVAAPVGSDEVAAVVRVAAAHRLSLLARGSGTKLDWGNPPTSVDLVVDLSGMRGVLEHATGDLVARVEAGTPLAALQEALSGAGQRLPVDELVPGSTIGGLVATGLSGPCRMLHGAVRDLITGLTFVRADGVVARSGSKVVKNVAGYDLARLLTGSYGTLGIITEVIFRLRPLATHRRYVAATFDDERQLTAPLQAMLGSQVAPSALEVGRAQPAGPVTLVALVEGREAGVTVRAAGAARLLGGTVSETDTPPAGWATLPGTTTLKVSAGVGATPAVLAAVRELGAEHGCSPSVRGSAGVGVLYVGLGPEVAPGALAGLVVGLRGRLGALGGNAVVLRCPAEVKASLDVWGPVKGLELMRRVKAQFDPDRRLAPGRFVGGI
ncbi:MAG TPA: FAD-binding oxidoreductase [Acidimicrobiales bacterium]|nr:FAD-binding oxidoreductase [Acidimicrobiales bacterium]